MKNSLPLIAYLQRRRIVALETEIADAKVYSLLHANHKTKAKNLLCTVSPTHPSKTLKKGAISTEYSVKDIVFSVAGFKVATKLNRMMLTVKAF